jgi:hypothetical protein
VAIIVVKKEVEEILTIHKWWLRTGGEGGERGKSEHKSTKEVGRGSPHLCTMDVRSRIKR